jgi:hypothetical protein
MVNTTAIEIRIAKPNAIKGTVSMEVAIGLGVVVAVVLFMVLGRGKQTFDDPKPMSNEHLMAAIAGQADWLEKMSVAPIESQKSTSIVELAKRRRGYIAQLCMEVVSRADNPNYSDASQSINPFSDAAEYAKELEGNGVGKENAAVRAVKEKMFVSSGIVYRTRWEV